MKGFIPLIVQRYLGSRRGFTRVVTVFSVLGILLGVAALMIVLAVMSGFRAELMGRILGVGGHGTLEIAGLQAPQARQLAAELRNIKGVVSVVPYVTGQVMVSAEGRATGAYIRGLEALPENSPLGTLPDAGQLAIGEGIAGSIGLLPGGGVVLLSPEGARTPFGFVPRTGTFVVGKVFSAGMVQVDNGLVIGRLDDVQQFLRKGQGVDALEIHLQTPDLIDSVAPAIMRVAQHYAETPLDVNFVPWTVANGEFFRALQVERVTMFIILSLIVLVAAFNIITGQMMLVNDKLSDIAILRTMGATQSQIRKIFFYNGLLLGGLGTAGGVALGAVVIWNMSSVVNGIKSLTGVDLFPRDVYFLSELPGRLSLLDMASVISMAVVLTVLASLYPAWKASLLNPVELLRRG